MNIYQGQHTREAMLAADGKTRGVELQKTFAALIMPPCAHNNAHGTTGFNV
jgi:hypothetical protein